MANALFDGDSCIKFHHQREVVEGEERRWIKVRSIEVLKDELAERL